MTAQRILRPSTAFSLDPSSGRKRPRQEDGLHLKFIRTLPCVICGARQNVHAAHIRTGSPQFGKRKTGLGEKASDKFTVPLCASHHTDGADAQHKDNEAAWWDRQGITIPSCSRPLCGLRQTIRRRRRSSFSKQRRPPAHRSQPMTEPTKEEIEAAAKELCCEGGCNASGKPGDACVAIGQGDHAKCILIAASRARPSSSTEASKRPLAFAVRVDHPPGWEVWRSEDLARKVADNLGTEYRGLYIKDGVSPSTEAMRRALEPFARHADGFEDRPGEINYARDELVVSVQTTVGELRRARDARSSATTPTPQQQSTNSPPSFTKEERAAAHAITAPPPDEPAQEQSVSALNADE